MPTLDAGLFLIISAIGFIFMFISSRTYIDVAFRLIPVFLLFGLGVALIAEYEVSYTAESTDGATTVTETRYILRNNTDWLGWVYVMLGTFSIVLFYKEIMYAREA